MKIFLEFIDEIYLSLKYSLKDIAILPGDNMLIAFYYSLGITVLSLLCFLFSLPFFLDWRGGLLGTCILGSIVLLGRRKNNEVSRSNGVTASRSGVSSSREENPDIKTEDLGIETNYSTGNEDIREGL